MTALLYACSTNPGKLREFVWATGECALPSYVVEPLPDLKQLFPPEETGATFEENASAKAAYYSGFTSELVFADDSGLAVDALGGAPGVYSARYAGPGANDAANNALVLRNLHGEADRTARFVCVIALARSGRVLQTFHASVEGKLLETPRGNNGFGYDPLFFYPPFKCSFAELSPEEKLPVSHRGKALRALFEWLCRWAK